MANKRILVKSSGGTYPIVCGAGALAHLGKEIARLGKFSSMHVVTSPKVWRAVKGRVLAGLGKKTETKIHLFDDRETAKSIFNVEKISRSLVRGGADRHSLVIAVGGGVVGDVAGFAAASYLRGVALVQVPTTLVAQTDSSIGGKTGVNLPEGKNLVGAFYAPRLVLVDPLVLKTLSHREFRGGLAEVIKYGVIADAKMFAFLEKHMNRAMRRDAKALEYLITRSAEIKAYVVSKDEKESGLREILNYGHTFGHALESVTAYRRYQHGEAVAWGMIAAALLGMANGTTSPADASRIIALTHQLGALPEWPDASPAKLIQLMRSDKKARAGQIRFVLASRIGKAGSYDGISLSLVEQVLRFVPKLADGQGIGRG